MNTSTLENRRQERVDRLEVIRSKHEGLLAQRDGANLNDTDRDQIRVYREETQGLLEEIENLSNDIDAYNKAAELSQSLRRSALGKVDGTDINDDGVVYRTMAAYARDVLLARDTPTSSMIAAQFGDRQVVEAARNRLDLLKRTPADTLSSDVGGLQPAQHINQIFQVIDRSRPIVQSANRSTLTRGTLTYPKIVTKPLVAVQNTEKTEGGNQKMAVDMETTTADTYLGGGDLSWQAINWSTPDALSLWFDLAAGSYALLTEQDAAQALQHSGFTYNISTTLAALTDFSDILAAVAAGAGDVYANSGRMADTIYMAPNAFFALAAVASTEQANFVNVGQLNLSAQGGNLAGLRVVVSRGMDTGVIVVGDSSQLLVAETAGAPIELRVVEPAIGGVEVGLIGAFEAVVTDPGAFAMITTAS